MRRYLFVVGLIILCLTSVAYGSEELSTKTPKNELSMYGGIERTPEEKQIDVKFIKDSIAQFGSREAPIKNMVATAWDYCNTKHDVKAAMKQFNQVWLLDPKNAEAFYGFGFLEAKKGDSDTAIKYYQKAIEFDPSHTMAMCRLADEYKEKALKLLNWDKMSMVHEGWEYWRKAIALYEKASKIAKLNKYLGYSYYRWAIALEWVNNHIEAWQKIKMVRKYDDQIIEPQFIKELSKSMKEPSNDISPATTESLGLTKRLFLTLTTDKPGAYVNEEIPISVKLYTTVPLVNIHIPSLIQNELSKPEFKEPRQYTKKIDDLIYDVLEFTAKISGTKPGSNKVGPAKTDCYVLTGNPKQHYDAYSLELKSQEIDVVILPSTNKSESK